MNIATVESVVRTYAEKQVLSGISFGIAEGERIGLIGVNGSGKSTLLQMVAGLVRPDAGAVTFRSGLSVAYLAQNPEFDPEATVLAAVFRGESPAIRVLRAYEQALSDLSARPGDAGVQSRLAQFQSQMDAQGLWSLEAQAKSILTRLGIDNFCAPVGALSGGERKRVAMARALIEPVDLLILDEPTNHIDNETVAWLEQYLSRFTGALLLVTHDRYFLDRVVTRILELDGGSLYTYAGNYGDYLEQKAARVEADTGREEKRQALLRRELAWLRRGARARTTKQKARIKRVEDLQEAQGAAGGRALEMAVSTQRLGREIIALKDVSKGFGGCTLIRDFSYTVLHGDRVGVIGPNGSGKSTLLNLIAGRVAPDAGRVSIGQTVRLAYYDQESGEMDPDQRVIDYVREVAEFIPAPDGGTITAAQMLERFLFPAAVQYTPLGKLSGGERRRLYLLRTLMSEPNVLLLDEPTNDLDIQTLTILEDYLDQFPGVVIAVSHDRYFLDRVVDHLFAFEGDGRVRRYTGGYADYLAEASETAAEAPPAPAQTRKDSTPGPGAPPASPLKMSFKDQREFETIENEIAALEARLAALAADIGQAAADYARLQMLMSEQETVEGELSHKLDRWAELTELAEAIAQRKADRQAGR